MKKTTEKSLRERRKQERRAAILAAAEKLFGEAGYQATTMDAIAHKAGVGVATVYNYFGTKAAILEGIIWPTLEQAFAAAGKVIANPPADPGEAMAQLIEGYRRLRDDWSDRRLLRALSMMQVDLDAPTSRLSQEGDERCLRQIRDLLLVLKGRGSIDARLDVDDAAFIVFCVFNQHYEYFLTNENVQARRLFSDLSRRIRLVFADWTVKKR